VTINPQSINDKDDTNAPLFDVLILLANKYVKMPASNGCKTTINPQTVRNGIGNKYNKLKGENTAVW